MTDNQVEIFIEIWESLKNYIPQKERNLAAAQYVSVFQDLGFDLERNQSDIMGNCEYLNRAVRDVIVEDEDDFSEDY